jgi:hypothetical protein
MKKILAVLWILFLIIASFYRAQAEKLEKNDTRESVYHNKLEASKNDSRSLNFAGPNSTFAKVPTFLPINSSTIIAFNTPKTPSKTHPTKTVTPTITSTHMTVTRTATQIIPNQPTNTTQPSETVVTETETQAPLLRDLGYETLPSLTFISIDTPHTSNLKKPATLTVTEVGEKQSPWLNTRGVAMIGLIFSIWLVLGIGQFLISRRLS